MLLPWVCPASALILAEIIGKIIKFRLKSSCSMKKNYGIIYYFLEDFMANYYNIFFNVRMRGKESHINEAVDLIDKAIHSV
jgi:hypothetical protein